MLLTIYDKAGNKRADVAVNDSSTQSKEVQGDNVLSLSFSYYAFLALDVNDYTDYLGERYWLTERYTPKQVSEGEWEYDLKLYGVESLIKRFLVLETTDGDTNPLFTLTATPREHVAMVVKAINDGMGHITDWKTGTVEGTELITIDYEGMYCDEALKAIAEKAGGKVEWWIEGQTVNVCRCEHGEEITLGYGKGLTSLERDTSNTAKFYTRLFPVGSTRNIDAEKYGSPRLMLPGGKKYIELGVEEYGIYDHYEQKAFSGIYPRRVGTVSSVRSEEVTDDEGKKFTIYYFRDSELNFDPNLYELADEIKRVSFQTGDLAGLGVSDDHYFEVNYDSAEREFELITIWPYDDDTQLPGGKLVPKVGDTYILWNIRMPDEYYRLAEDEFQKAVNDYNKAYWMDIAVYKAPTDHEYIERHKIDLYPGRRVRLESTEYFPKTGYRSSRITKISRMVNLPSQVELEIGDALSVGVMEEVGNEITNIKNHTKVLASALPDIVRSWENTKPTDNNLFSALKVLKEIEEKAISRKKDDTASGLITFLKGLCSHGTVKALDGFEVGEFIDSMVAGKGAGIFPDGRMQLSRLEVRDSLTVLELIFNRLSAMESDYSFSESGTIESVSQLEDGTYSLKMKKRWDNDFTALAENDVVYGVVNDLVSGGGKYYTSWLRVLHVDISANTINAVMYPDSEVPGGKNYPPEPLMILSHRGNPVDEERQGYWYLSSREHCICMLNGVTKPVLEESNYSVIVGRLKHLSLFDNLPINYLHSYIYVRGLVAQDIHRIDFQGVLPRIANDRGEWSMETATGAEPYQADREAQTETVRVMMYDTVWHYGCKWMCLVSGTTDEPKYGAAGWAMIEGNPDFSIDIESSNGWYFDAERFATTLTITGELYNRDVTAHILDSDVEWTRDTGNVTEDNAWAVAHAETGKSLPLTVNDLGPNYMNMTGCKFIARVLLRDGQNNYETMNYITF